MFEKSSKPATVKNPEGTAAASALSRRRQTTEGTAGPQQADDHGVSRECSLDGTCRLLQEDGIDGISGVIAPGGQS